MHKPIYIEGSVEVKRDGKVVDTIGVEVAIQYTIGEEERVRCYANNIHNPDGGTHSAGFKAAVTRVCNKYAAKHELFKDIKPTGDDMRKGMTAIVSVKTSEPQFESNNKNKLTQPEVEGSVASIVGKQLGIYLEENPKLAARIMKKIVIAAETRMKTAVKDRKSTRSDD